MSVHHRPVEVVGVKVFGQSTSSAFCARSLVSKLVKRVARLLSEEGRGLTASAPSLALIHRSAWKGILRSSHFGDSPKFDPRNSYMAYKDSP